MTHRIEVSRSVFRRDHWLARCSCGWAGELRPREVEARMDGDDHIEKCEQVTLDSDPRTP